MRKTLTLLALAATCHLAAAGNLVKNGDFAAGLKDWGGFGPAKREIAKDGAANCLALRNPDDQRSVATQTLDLPCGSYTVSLWVKGEGVKLVAARFILNEADTGKWKSEIDLGSVADTAGDWKPLRSVVFIPEGVKSVLWLYSAGQGSACFRDACVVPGRPESSGNLLWNSSFNFRSNPDVPDWWGMTGYVYNGKRDWDSGKYISYSDDPAPVPGASVLRLGDGNLLWAVGATLKPIPGKYAFSVWARSDDSDASLTFGKVFGGDAKSHPVGKEWRRLTFIEDFSGSRKVGFGFKVPSGKTVLVCAPQLELADAPTDYGPSEFDRNFRPLGAGAENEAKPAPAFVCPRATAVPVVDGKLDDPCWENAHEFGGLVDNSSGGAAPVKTQAWIIADGEALHLAFRCEEPAPDKLKADRPKNIYSGDNLEIFLNPGFAGNRYYRLAVSPHGQQDATNGLNGVWIPGVLPLGVAFEDGAWTLETSIPLDKIELGDGPEWGIGLGRGWIDHRSNDPTTKYFALTKQGYHNAANHAPFLALRRRGSIPVQLGVMPQVSACQVGDGSLLCRITGAKGAVGLTMRNAEGAVVWKGAAQGGESSIPLKGLTPGGYRVTVAEGTDSAVSEPFQLVRSGVPLVSQDRFRRCLLVEGKPFLPICYDALCGADMRWLPAWKYPELRAKGFNTILLWMQFENNLDRGDLRGAIKLCELACERISKEGFKIIMNVGTKHPSAKTLGREGLDERVRDLAALVKYFEFEPAIIAWYVLDEPGKEMETEREMLEYYRALKRVGTNKPVFINYNWCGMSEGAPPWGGHACNDLHFLDCYPFSGCEIYDPLARYAYFTALGNRQAAELGRVQMMWLQTYDNEGRQPSPDEFENMLWQSLLFGSRGFAFFSGRPSSTSLWKREGELNHRIAALEPVMLAEDFKVLGRVRKVNDGPNWAFWEGGGKRLLLLANSEYVKQPLSLDLKAMAGKDLAVAKGLFGAVDVKLDNGLLKVELPPAATRTYQVE